MIHEYRWRNAKKESQPFKCEYHLPTKNEPLSTYSRKTRFRRMLMALNGWSRVTEDEFNLCKHCKTPAECISILKHNHLKTASVWRIINKEPFHKPLDVFEVDRCFKLFYRTEGKTYADIIKKILVQIDRADLIVFLR